MGDKTHSKVVKVKSSPDDTSEDIKDGVALALRSAVGVCGVQPQTAKKRAVIKMTQYLCPVCDLVYQSENSQTAHISKYHYQSALQPGESIQCVVCSANKSSVHQMVEHARSHQAYAMFRCGLCSTVIPPEKGFRARHNLMYHRAKIIKPKVLSTCSQCAMEVSSSSELAYHVLSTHGDTAMTVTVNQSRDYECNYCILSFSKLKSLYAHIKAMHGVHDDDDVDFSLGEEEADEVGDENGDDETVKRSGNEVVSRVDVLQYLCPVCDVSYQSVHLQVRHFVRYHWVRNDDGTFSCPSCPSAHTDLIEMVQHARNMHQNTLYSCIRCPAVLPPEKVFRRKHMMQEHRGPRITLKRVHPCWECDLELPTLSELAYHSLIKHSNQHLIAKVKRKSHQCNYCNSSFCNQTTLIRHIVAKHDREQGTEAISIHEQDEVENVGGNETRTKLLIGIGPPYSCQPCQKVYKSSSTYIAHLRYYCGKSREEKRLLRGKEKTYLCNHCGAVLTSYSGFQTHMANHYDRNRFKCDLCPKAFAKRGQLNFHRRTHARTFICQSCGKRFKTLSHLKDHQITHSDDLSFACPACAQHFKWRPTLMRHLYKVHGTGVKPDSSARRKMLCLLCNMKVNSGKRTKHFQRRHKEIAYDLKYFTLISSGGATVGESVGQGLECGVVEEQQRREVEVLGGAGTAGMDQLATAAQVIGLSDVVTAQPVLPILTPMPASMPASVSQTVPTLTPLVPVHSGVTVTMPSSGVVYTPQMLEIKLTERLQSELLQPQHNEAAVVPPPTYITPLGAVYSAMQQPTGTSSVTDEAQQSEEGLTFDVVSMQAALDAHQQQGGHYQVIQDQSGVPVVIQPQWQ